MPYPQSIVHGRRGEAIRANGRFGQLVAILEPSVSKDATGGQVRAFGIRSGFEQIPAMVSRPTRGAAGGRSEQLRGVERTAEVVVRVALLAGDFADITTSMRARLSDGDYDIEAIDIDSQQSLTRLHLRRVR